ATVTGSEYPSLTPELPALHWFEREIAEQYSIIPQGHPHLKPIRFHRDHQGRSAFGEGEPRPGVTDYLAMSGDAAHEVAVGPVHAGVIEPGHFRFQCMGETVYSLEIELGYQHRGIEKMLEGGPSAAAPHLFETAAGDTSIANAVNYSMLIEALGGIQPPRDALLLREIALELERMANHTGDMGALAGDVAFLPTASFCGRIRGDILNLTAEIAGNRFGRNLVIPGGTSRGLEVARAADIRKRLETAGRELFHAVDLMLNAPTVLDRFENTGTVSLEDAAAAGLVGVAGRACGIAADARTDFPHPGSPAAIPAAFGKGGDVMARINVRYQELKASLKWLLQALDSIKADIPACTAAAPRLQPDSIAVAVTEGWRGENVAAAITDGSGCFRRCKLVDASFHNWFGLALALRSEEISNFPICNKSFNLSYCGHDL
ncbi:MAG: NADH-quinone oxidoreductase subunit C, partial [Victivallales bacterium]|nr:NADH-quinone oxidoreductase subunit C [Victivallales bacterium]